MIEGTRMADDAHTNLWPHVDHDISRLIAIHDEMKNARWRDYNSTVRRALNVAYAVAFRSVLEFAHSGRPSGLARSEDITSRGLLGASLSSEWSEEEKGRLADADKLVAHLSKGRVERVGMDRDWGDAADKAIWEPYVARLLEKVPEKLPMAVEARAKSTA
jgi:hypothetical protein